MPKLNQFKLRLVSNLFVACLGGAFAGSLFGQQLDLQTPQPRGAYSYPTSAGYHSSWDSWIGIRDTVNLDIAKLNSFFIYNVGARDELGALPTYSHDGFALRTELAGLQIGPGRFCTLGTSIGPLQLL